MVLAGLWLVGLAVTLVVAPERGARFLERFASSARAHFTEQTLRLVAGAAMVVFAAEMKYAELFRVFGWILIVTAIALMLTPWRWHHRYGEWVIPLAIRHRKLFALGALALGAAVLYCALAGP